MNDIIIDKNDLINPTQEQSLAIKTFELQEQISALEEELAKNKEILLNNMTSAGITSIKTTFGKTITVVEKSADKVDQVACREFLDSQNIYEEFSKIDDSKVKKIYPTASFIIKKEPTRYIQIK
jgi:hypothetical protein